MSSGMRERCFLFVVFVLPGNTVMAQPIIPLKNPQAVVVYDSGVTVDATRYYQGKLSGEVSGSPKATNRKPIPLLALEDRLPLHSPSLAAGELRVIEVKGMYSPVFVMGMDNESLEWFKAAAGVLAQVGASGIVVEAWDRDEWRRLKDDADNAGIKLSLLGGDPLGEAYGFSTYPTVLTPTRERQEEQSWR